MRGARRLACSEWGHIPSAEQIGDLREAYHYNRVGDSEWKNFTIEGFSLRRTTEKGL